MVPGHPGVVLVDFSEAVLPVVEFAGADADPGEEARSREFGLLAPLANEINDGVTGVVGDPAAF